MGSLMLNVKPAGCTEEETSMDASVWGQLPRELLTKILCEHLPLEHVFRTGLVERYFSPCLLKRCVLVYSSSSWGQMEVVLHSIGSSSKQWTPLQLPRGAVTAVALSASEQGVLLLSCRRANGDKFFALSQLSPSGPACMLEDPTSLWRGETCQRQCAAQVVHMKNGAYKLVVLYSAIWCSYMCYIFDSGKKCWSQPNKVHHGGRKEPCILYLPQRIRDASEGGEVAIPSPFIYKKHSICFTDNVAVVFLTLAGPGSSQALCALELDRSSNTWRQMPGPSSAECQHFVASAKELTPMGSDGDIAVFHDCQGRLIVCNMETWEWHCCLVEDWKQEDGTPVRALSLS